MMEAKDICISLETAKRLFDSGIVVDSLYSWQSFDDKEYKLDKNRQEEYLPDFYEYPAPQAEELKIWLAKNRKLDKKEGQEICRLICIPTDTKWNVCYMSNTGVIAGGVGEIIENERLCEALAELCR